MFDFLHVDTNSHKLKVDKFFFVGMVKNECGHFGHRILRWTHLKNAHVEQTDVFNASANSGKLKVALMIFGWA